MTAPLAPSNPMSPDEVRREAERLADERVAYLKKIVVVAFIWVFFAFAADLEAATIITLICMIFLAPKGYNVLVAPELRQVFIQMEVDRRRALAAPEIRAVETRHSRSLEELSASIAHEIRNPITAAKSLVQQIGEDPGAAENGEYAKIALEELDRVERSIAHLLKYARDIPLETAPVLVPDVVESALETFKDRLAQTGVEIARAHEGDGLLYGDAEKLRRIVINLVANAIDELEAQKTLGPKIEISSGEDLAGTNVWLKVRDNGPGIPAEKLSKIWNPFFTTKAHGTGLGLAITRKMVEAHGGKIEVTTITSGVTSTEFTVTLPKGAKK